MSIRIVSAVTLACLLAGSLWAAESPFCGNWQLNREKSKLTGDRTKIEELGSKKYNFTFPFGSYTVTADGTDQLIPAMGISVALSNEGADTLRQVIKSKDGKILSVLTRSVPDGGNTQVIKGTQTLSDGSKSTFEKTLKRIGPGSGFTGTWETIASQEASTSSEGWNIKPYGTGGLTFYSPTDKHTVRINFDGNEYPEEAPGEPQLYSWSGRRVAADALDVKIKFRGKPYQNLQWKLSADQNTLTVLVNSSGEPNARLYVYDRTGPCRP